MPAKWLAVIIAILVALPSYTAAAPTYPTKPVTIVVPFPPGGSTDALARLLGKQLSDKFSQPFIIENRPGAGGTIGTHAVTQAPADGHTLLVYHVSLATNPALYPQLPYDTLKDIAPVSRVGSTPSLLVVNSSVPIHSVRELIAAAKKDPGKLNYSSGGVGSATHLAAALFENVAGVRFTHIPYKGGVPAITALLAGEVSFAIAVVPDVLQHVRAGKLRAIAVTTEGRYEGMPELPTIAELGLPGYEYTTWYGLFAPGATPRPVIAELNKAVNELLKQPDFQRELNTLAIEPGGSTAREFTDLVRSEVAKWKKIITTGAVKAN